MNAPRAQGGYAFYLLTRGHNLLLKRPTTDYLRHNKARLIRGGREYFDLLLKLIDEASESIHFQTYIFDADETGREVSDALIRASERGVKIYLLLDAYGSQALSDEFANRWKSVGILFRRFQPLFKSKRFYLGRRLHHKVVVVDSTHCTVAGLNISNRYNDTSEGPAWLDWALYVQGDIAPALEEICKSRMRLKKRTATSAPKVKIEEQCPIRVRVNDWVRRKRQIYRSYLEMFRDARSRITIMSAYFLPGRQFRKHIEAAIRRGVKIKVIVTGDADVFMVKYAERYIYRWLFKNNIEVYEYRKNVLHGKLALADGQFMTVGSYNVNNLSAFASVEMNLDVNDPQFVNDAEKRIEEIVAQDCVRITEKKFNRQYNAFNRAVHRSSYEIFRFLLFLSTKQRGD
jgi:cardiolipin synthase A/B